MLRPIVLKIQRVVVFFSKFFSASSCLVNVVLTIKKQAIVQAFFCHTITKVYACIDFIKGFLLFKQFFV